MKHPAGILSLILAGQLAWLSPAVLGGEVPPPERLLPSDTLAVLTVPEYSKSKDIFRQSALSQFWNDAAMKPFHDKFSGKFSSEIIAPLEKELGIQFSDYSGLAQGQITLALTANGPKEKDEFGIGFVFLVDCRDKGSQLQTNLTTLKKKWVDGGRQVRVEKIRDIEFTTLLFEANDVSKMLDKVFPGQKDNAGDNDKADKKDGKKLEWMLGQSGSLLVVGNSTRDIEKVLVNQSGGGAGVLADQSAFTTSQNSSFRDSQGYAWVHLKAIVDLISKAAAKGGDNGGMSPDKIMSALGISALQALSLSLKNTPDGSLMNVNVDAPESARRGLLKVFAFESKDASPPPFVPADALKFMRWRIDLPKSWDMIEKTLTDVNPQFSGVIKMVLDSAGKDQDPNFDLRKNLIQNLGDDIISIEKAPRKMTLEELNSAPTLTLISSPRPEQLASSIRALTALMPAQASKFKEREFLGRKVYALGLPPSMASGGKPVEKTIHYSASGGYVAISMDIAMLEEYLRSSESPGKALRDTPGLSDIAQKVGGMNTGFFSFENLRETTRFQVEILKKESGTLANLFSSSSLAGKFGMADNANKFKEWVDFSLLPPYDQISKYFYQTVAGGAVTPQGFTFKVYTANSPEMKK